MEPDRENIREVLHGEAGALLFDRERPMQQVEAILSLAQPEGLRRRLGETVRNTFAEDAPTWRANAPAVLRQLEHTLYVPALKQAETKL